MGDRRIRQQTLDVGLSNGGDVADRHRENGNGRHDRDPMRAQRVNGHHENAQHHRK